MTATQQRTAMQQPVHVRESTAPQLDPAAPWQPRISPEHRAVPAGDRGRGERTRTPLALVPAPIRRSGRGFVTFCVGILVAALLTVLVINISVSNRQYEMVSLKGEQLDLTQSNELLRQQVEHLEAPQNLAAEAAKLGMVRPGDIASIDLSTGKVSGTASAAEDGDVPSGLVAAPQGPGAGTEQDGSTAEASGPEARAAAPEGTAPEGADAAPEAPADVQASTGRAPAGDGEAADAPPAVIDAPAPAIDGEPAADTARGEELNGGTIPAPQFSAGGR
ncbi:hypothetical protein E7744_06235 [Citricoccus sp. SGAir0253]|uniref:hypothetical protein n=1 Tax=Citricoccus sp. SGAir0253 TaxID=2567881 RepID=UPI0010CD0238|nr:hypothetical protein [Citricoccus sp. SGAir0253]QCU77833.1 hypothetical protein E7744_06235 [Citricoccus sp. SGAir0253]